MEYLTDEKVSDSPDDITSADLTIRAVSGNISPVIYANGRNQLPVEIIVKAMKENPDGSETILKFTAETWLHILNLRHAETDKKLTKKGRAGWCFTSSVNDYSHEVTPTDNSVIPREMEPGDELMTLYVYTDDINTKRIAVSLDTDGGKHFTTADNASGAERNSVTVRAIQPLVYLTSNLIQDVVNNMGESKASMNYDPGGTNVTKSYDAHYDNFYFSIENKINSYAVYNYGGDGSAGSDYPDRVALYWVEENNDQRMLIAHPSDLPGGEGTFGFFGRDTIHPSMSADIHIEYQLFQKVKYNDRPKTICWTHLLFSTSQAWVIDDGSVLHVNDTPLHNFNLDPWFEFYDLYGNYGAFTIRYNSTSHKIEVDQK